MVDDTPDLRSKALAALRDAFGAVAAAEYDEEIQTAASDELEHDLLAAAWDHQFDTDLSALKSKAKRVIREVAEARPDAD